MTVLSRLACFLAAPLCTQERVPAAMGITRAVDTRAICKRPEYLLLFNRYRSARGFVTQSRNVCCSQAERWGR